MHPCHATHPKDIGYEVDTYFDQIHHILKADTQNKIVAVGECGLDYDRLEYADKQT